MAAYDLSIWPDGVQLARAAAEYFVACAKAAIAQRGIAYVCLAGGSTPKAMNALLAQAPLRAALDWSKLRFFFGDERCVPYDHADSNFRMTRESLFDPLAIAAEYVFRIRGEDEPHAAARAYEQTLRRELGAEWIFDLVFLGMGPDGHTASLFPGTLGTLDLTRACVANFVPKFDAFRITLTPRVINAARDVAITAGGAEKAEALRAVLGVTREPDVHPVELVAPLAGKLHWFVDTAAASLLP